MADTPNIRFRGFTDDWKQCKFEEICKLYQGLQIPLSERFTEPGINRYFYITNEFLKDTCEEAYYIESPSESVVCNEEDILMTRTGNTGIVVTDVKGCFHNNFFKIKYDKDTFSKKYICFLLSTSYMQKVIMNSAGSSTIPDLSHKAFYKIVGCFPTSKEEQDKIGNNLANMDNLIILHQRKCDETKELKKYMLQKMFPKEGKKIPEIRFAGFTGDWKQRKLGDVGDTYTGLSGKSKDDFGHGSGKFVTYMNVFSNTVGSSDMTEAVEIDDRQNKVLFGDVLFTTSSETPEEVGMSSVWLENAENTYLNSFCFGYRPRIEFNPYYLAYMLRSFSIRKKITYLAQGISRYNISKNKMMEIEIPIPQIEEQKKIGDYFRHLDHFITLHQRKCDQLKEVKKFMLQNMFPQKG